MTIKELFDQEDMQTKLEVALHKALLNTPFTPEDKNADKDTAVISHVEFDEPFEAINGGDIVEEENNTQFKVSCNLEIWYKIYGSNKEGTESAFVKCTGYAFIEMPAENVSISKTGISFEK